jgi:hypothetical protein
MTPDSETHVQVRKFPIGKIILNSSLRWVSTESLVCQK